MRRHVRNTCKIVPNEKNGVSGMELLYRHTIQKQQEQMTVMQEQLNEMAAMMQQMASSGQKASSAVSGEVAIVASGDQSEIKLDNSKHQHITVNVFGQERLDHITQQQIRQILTGVQAFSLPEAATQSVLRAAMLAYSDPEHPENLTCYLPNKKTKDALVHGGTGWEIQPVQIVLPPMVSKSVDVLFDKQPREGDDVKSFGKILKALQECEKDSKTMKQLAGPDGALRAVLIRNKDQLTRILAKLPVAGQS